MADQQNNNNQNEVTREGFGTKFRRGAKAVWDFTRPARNYVADVVGMAGMYAAAGGAMVAGAWFVADKLTKNNDPDASDASDEEAVSAEDTTPDE